MRQITYTILESGYSITDGKFITDLDSPSSVDTVFDSLSEVRDVIFRMLQYSPNSSEFDIRYANDTVLVLTILTKKDDGCWKAHDKYAYVAACDVQYLKDIKPFIKGKKVVTIQKTGTPFVKDTVIPLTLESAADIQSGRKKGFISWKRSENEHLQLVQLVGTDTYLLQVAGRGDCPGTFVPGQPCPFVVHVIEEFPGIPLNLEGREPFRYNGLSFIPAGGFEDFGLRKDCDLLEVSPHLYHRESDPLVPDWRYDGFYQAVPEEELDNDIFWVVEKGAYLCPGNYPFQFKQ